MQIIDLKKKIQSSQGLLVEKQKLIYKGKVLEDSVILCEAGFKDEDSLVLMKLIDKKPQETKADLIVDSEKKDQKKNS